MRDFIHFATMFGKAFWLTRGPLLAILGLVLIASFILFHFEEYSYWEALYMTLITALTIGYGDLTPITPVGKIVSIGVGFIGLVFVGLVVAIATTALRHTTITHNRRKKDRV